MPDWNAFCDAYMKRVIVNFDKSALLADLTGSKFIQNQSGEYHFKYKLFYSYFLGRHVANRPKELAKFLDNNLHLNVDGLVEVISGLSADNTALVENLTEKLENSIKHFYGHYDLRDFDPVADFEWKLSLEEEQKTWDAVATSLQAGPTSSAELDKLKTSVMAERRTDNQFVIIRDFNLLERSLLDNKAEVITAISNAVDIEGELKLRAVRAIVEAYTLIYRLGFVFAPAIASRRYFMWNDIAFVNKIAVTSNEDENHLQNVNKIASAIPRAVTEKAADEFGSRKLGEVFKYLLSEETPKDFQLYVLFCLLIRAKPHKWGPTAENVINNIDRRALYLKYMLGGSMSQFHDNVNTNFERGLLKRIVARIHVKRGQGKAAPGEKAVNRMLAKLEDGHTFSQGDPTIEG